MKRTTIFIDEAVEAELQALARRQNRPTASLVRDAVSEYVQQHTRRLDFRLGFVASGRSGHADTAERHEELLWESPHGRAAGRPTRPARSTGTNTRRRSGKS